jgi:lysophospholipase L1-like esterase
VVAFGNSVTALQSPGRAHHADGTFVEVLADRLAAEGVPAVPHLEARWFDFLHRAIRQYPERVRAHAPDVLVVQFGFNEYQPWLLPVWLLRHLMSRGEAVTRSARRYRRHVSEPMWRLVRGYRRFGSSLVGTRTWHTTPRRFEGHLRRLLRIARDEGRPLVLVLDLQPPDEKLEHFLPGLAARHAVYQGIYERVVADAADPDVRLVRASQLTAALDPATGDGIHYTPHAHRVIGEALAEQVLEWVRAQQAHAGARSPR